MANIGKIKSYDTAKGSGMITPEKGGEPITFVKADLQQEAAEPKAGDRFGYDTRQVGGGKPQAVNLQLQAGETADAKQAEAQAS